MRPPKINDPKRLLPSLKRGGWVVRRGALQKTFVFDAFETALDYLKSSGKVIARENHHPIILNTHNKVEFRLTTHDAGNKVTEKDLRLAALLTKVTKRKRFAEAVTPRATVVNVNDNIILQMKGKSGNAPTTTTTTTKAPTVSTVGKNSSML